MSVQKLLPVLFLIVGILQPASAQTSLAIALTVNPLSCQAPCSPSYPSSYRGAVGSVSLVVYWGDGSSANLSSCGYNCPGHTYSSPGTYTITISISDSTGATSDSKTITVQGVTQSTYNFQVGALGDNAAQGNKGVGVEIRTSIFPLASQASGDSFWVGDNLQNGAFIQFGYEIQTPGNYCLYGQSVGGQTTCLGSFDTVGSGDARWFWEYWPNGTVNDFYFGTGRTDSAGQEGSWHHYQILPDLVNGWNFLLDEQSVLSLNNFTIQKSRNPAYFVAEEVTNVSSASGSLGPVEFRNLSYLNQNDWEPVESLTAISNCNNITLALSSCNISMPYGLTVLGANDILAGTGEQMVEAGSLLWETQTVVTTESLQTVAVTQSLFTNSQGPPGFTLSVSPSSVFLQPGNFIGSPEFTLSLSSRDGKVP